MHFIIDESLTKPVKGAKRWTYRLKGSKDREIDVESLEELMEVMRQLGGRVAFKIPTDPHDLFTAYVITHPEEVW